LSYKLGPVVITRAQLLSFACSTAILIGILLLLRFSRVGLRLRALSVNAIECELRGIDVARIRAVTYIVAGLLGSASGLLAARESGFDPHGGLLAGLPAIVALIIGGRRSFLGPISGALALGVIRAAATWSLSAGWQEPVTFLVLAGFLLFRPNGVIQRPEISELAS